jgi:hypothetical protein
MTMVMPLGVLANQLVKIEGDLRFLWMKAAERAGDECADSTKAIDARLALIHEALDSIGALLVRLRADIHPKATSHSAAFATDESRHSKPTPERDD